MGLDAASFEAIYAANADRVYSTAYRLLRDRDAAADVVQDAFLKAFTAAEQIDNPAAWLTTVARNGALNALRRSGRLTGLAEEASDDDVATAPELVADEPTADPVHAAATADQLAIVDDLLAELSPAQRTALLLFHAQDQPIAAIAAVLGRTVNATTVFLHRSRAALRAGYAERIYARTTIPAVCRAFKPELLAHVAGKPASAPYLEHLASDPVCQAIEAELRGMGRVLGLLPLLPAPAALKVDLAGAVATHTGATAAATGMTHVPGATAVGGTSAGGAGGTAVGLGATVLGGIAAGKLLIGGAVAVLLLGGVGFVLLPRSSAAVTVPSLIAEMWRDAPTEPALDSWFVTAGPAVGDPNAVWTVPATVAPFRITDYWPWGYTLRGHFIAPLTGTYRFWTNSDDGSNLLIDGLVVVQNGFPDAAQYPTEKEGDVELQSGSQHTIVINIMDKACCEYALAGYWQAPGGSKAFLLDASGNIASPFRAAGIGLTNVPADASIDAHANGKTYRGVVVPLLVEGGALSTVTFGDGDLPLTDVTVEVVSRDGSRIAEWSSLTIRGGELFSVTAESSPTR